MGIFRLLLALGVMAEHAGRSQWVDSYTAVQAFFIVSGFYMSFIMQQNKYSVKNFYLTRVLRIFPVYYFALAVIFPLLIYSHLSGNQSTIVGYVLGHELNYAEFFWFYFINGSLIGADSVWFFNEFIGNQSSPLVHLLILPPSWSLSLELYFYVLAPYICRSSVRVILSIILASLSLRLILYTYGFDENPFHGRFFPTELALFCLGVLSQKIRHRFTMARPISASVILALFAFAILFKPLSIFLDLPYLYKDLYFIPSILFYCLIFIALPYLFASTANSLLDRYLGELSFPIYLIHYGFVAIFVHGGGNGFWEVIACSVIFAVVSVHFVIKPIDRFRHRYALT